MYICLECFVCWVMGVFGCVSLKISYFPPLVVFVYIISIESISTVQLGLPNFLISHVHRNLCFFHFKQFQGGQFFPCKLIELTPIELFEIYVIIPITQQ